MSLVKADEINRKQIIIQITIQPGPLLENSGPIISLTNRRPPPL